MAADALAHRYRNLISNSVASEDFVQVHYRVTSSTELDLAGAALRLLLITTRRTLEPVAYETDISTRDQATLGAVVSRQALKGRSGNVTLALPIHLCSEREGITQLLLNATAGAEYNYASELWIEDVDLPSAVLAWFPGPRHGIDGIRQRLRIYGRPLVGMTIKSRIGKLAPVLTAVREALEGGVDVIVDDLLMTDPDGEMSFSSRVEQVAQVVSSHNSSQPAAYSRAGYLVNIGSSPFQAADLLTRAAEIGVLGCLVDGFTMGFGAIKELADRAESARGEPIVVTTNMGSGVLGRHPDDEELERDSGIEGRSIRTGISEAPTAKLSRICGADAVHTGTSGSECFYPAEFNVAPRTLADTIGGLRRSLPVAEGDLQITHIYDNLRLLGNDLLIETASGIVNHPDGVRSGARAYRAVAGALHEDMDAEDGERVLVALSEQIPEVARALEQLAWKPALIDTGQARQAKQYLLASGSIPGDLQILLSNPRKWDPRVRSGTA